jgi:hypothetical protein
LSVGTRVLLERFRIVRLGYEAKEPIPASLAMTAVTEWRPAMGSGNKGTTKSFDKPDDRVSKGGVEIEVVQLGDVKVKRATYPVGWRFSRDMGAPKCLDTHVGYALSGRIMVELDDGTRFETGPGAAFMIPAGHDAYVVGDEPAVIVQFDEGESAASRFNVPSVSKAA